MTARARRPLSLTLPVLLVLVVCFAACAREQRVEPAPGQRPIATAPQGVRLDAGPLPPAQASTPAVTAASDAGATPSPEAARIDIQPLGVALPEADVAFVERSLRAFYAVEVRRLERVDLPESALNAARGRYRAEKLLDFLEARRAPETRFVLGLTGVDISTTKPPHADWGILGLATLDGTACVISSFRTRRLAKDGEHARIRLGKVAVHEVGHNLGLEHCPERGCLMEDALGTVLTTDREYELCQRCTSRLHGVALTGAALEIPWPRPESP